MAWKTVDGSYENTAYAQFDTFFRGLFQRERCLTSSKILSVFPMRGRGHSKYWRGIINLRRTECHHLDGACR